MSIEGIIQRCEELYEDLDLSAVRAWKAEDPGRKAVGFLPTYVPREILHAAGVLPVGVLGAGDQLEIVKGDAYFQSYICHFPRSVVELGLSERLDVLDGMLFPATCDVIRNLSGIWQLVFPTKYVKYFDVPQNFDPSVGGSFYRGILEDILHDMERLTGHSVDHASLTRSIHVYNENRRLMQELYDLRAKTPWVATTSEVYLLTRAGMVLPVEEHSAMLGEYLDLVKREGRRELDNARVLLRGAFCEQPPLTLIRTLERSGCYVVDDDFMLVARWLGQVEESGDPLDALVRSYLGYGGETSSKYVPDGGCKGADLVDCAHKCGAEGVIFAAPSFCDPALLDRPMLQTALQKEGLSYTSFKYAENTGQMQPIREQAGTFADTIKLWGNE
ncbi:MAG: benzoyl-CoA reductase subunit C [Deltaproteobacteria bacterium]|nr:benzoyl-CoA reductase subunit C [Deltaproteobacteria bacterium]